MTFNFSSRFVFLCLLQLVAVSLFSQYGIANFNTPYVENFNSLPYSGSLTQPFALPNWYASMSNIRYSDGSRSGAYLYSLGTANKSERALGAVAAGGTSIAFGLRMKNTMPSDTIRSLTVTYLGEQWREGKAEAQGEQILRFSYKVANAPITTVTTSEVAYTKVPFLNFVSPNIASADTTKLDGNLASNRVWVKAKFNVKIAPNNEIMLKWFDKDEANYDHGLAIDSLKIEFSSLTLPQDVFLGNTPIAHCMKGIIADIPVAGDAIPSSYVVPSNAQLTAWRNAIKQIMRGQYASAYNTLKSNDLQYCLTQYNDAATGRVYYIVSKTGEHGTANNFWGTYVFSPNAARKCISFQAPHPIHDTYTGEQSTYLFRELDAYSLSIAGTHRCFSTIASNCAGSTGPCRADSLYTISDAAHSTGTAFQATHEVIADSFTTARFVQMHGFNKQTNDPHFIISNGTRQTPNTDFVQQLGTYLNGIPKTNISPEPSANWSFQAPHLNTAFNKLISSTNMQGRYVNSYNNGNICTSTTISTTVTGRFMAIEQYSDVRTNPANYPLVKNAFLNNNICNCNLAPARFAAVISKDTEIIPNHVSVRYTGTSDELVMHIETAQTKIQIQVLNLLGQVVYQSEVNIQNQINLPFSTQNYGAGMYILSVDFGNEVRSEKFLIQ